MTIAQDHDTQVGHLQYPNLASGTMDIVLNNNRGHITLLRSDDEVLFQQCILYRKKHDRVMLRIFFDEKCKPVEYDSLIGIENMALWRLCRTSAIREVEAHRFGVAESFVRGT